MSKKLAYTFDPFKLTGIKVPQSERAGALDAVSNFVKEQVLSSIGEGISPVQNGKWKRSLSPEYKKEKGKTSSAKFANLELSGDLLDSLEVEKTNSKLTLTVASDQMGKAEGNQIGSYGKSPNAANAREFIPTNGRTFKKAIIDGIKEVLKDYGKDNS